MSPGNRGGHGNTAYYGYERQDQGKDFSLTAVLTD